MKMRCWFCLAALAALLAGAPGPAHAAGSGLDRKPVSAAEFGAFLRGGKSGPDKDAPRNSVPNKDAPQNEAAVNLSWHKAGAYCAAQGKRLPSAREWIAACEARELAFPWWIWEWTTTDAGRGEAGFKILCGPGPSTCECTHAYHTTWSNEVKGFRCAKADPSVRRLEN